MSGHGGKRMGGKGNMRKDFRTFQNTGEGVGKKRILSKNRSAYAYQDTEGKKMEGAGERGQVIVTKIQVKISQKEKGGKF